MQPDVIFFLTDAGRAAAFAHPDGEIHRLAGETVSINTIEFGYGPKSGGESFLAKLARQNNGQYAYVDITRLGTRAAPPALMGMLPIAGERILDHEPRLGPTLALLVVCCCGSAGADTVEMANSGGGRTKLTGQVSDYTGTVLTMEHAGQRRDIPGDRVLSVTTEYGPKHLEADRLSAAGRSKRRYRRTSRRWTRSGRGWVKRKILADLVRCYQGLGDSQSAGLMFLALVREDPKTPYFDCIPLAWVTAQPERLARADRPAVARPGPRPSGGGRAVGRESPAADVGSVGRAGPASTIGDAPGSSHCVVGACPDLAHGRRDGTMPSLTAGVA